jgi:hypothetical protein
MNRVAIWAINDVGMLLGALIPRHSVRIAQTSTAAPRTGGDGERVDCGTNTANSYEPSGA